MTLIKNVRFGFSEKVSDGFVTVENGRIESTGRGTLPENVETIDGEGLVLCPGLCDIHTHGARLIDFTLSSAEEMCRLEDWYSSCGVTSLFPTTTTQTFEQILRAVDNIRSAAKMVTKIHIDGIHIEGPFLSHKRRGAHNEALLKLPDINLAGEIIKRADGLKVRMTVAPEIKGAMEFIEKALDMGIMITLGHSEADFETVMQAIKLGANCVTHTFNGMNPLHHRSPGLLGAALAEDVYSEIICDGLHVHPEVVKLFSKAKGNDRAVLITDSVTLAGCSENEIGESAGLRVHIVGGAIRTLDTGDLAGSSLKLCDGVRNYADFSQKSLDEAVLCASRNPSELCGLYRVCGSVDKGKRADFALFSDDGALCKTICNGKVVFANQNGVCGK